MYNFDIMRIEATQNSFGNVPLVSISWNDFEEYWCQYAFKGHKEFCAKPIRIWTFWLGTFLIITLIAQGAMDFFSLFI